MPLVLVQLPKTAASKEIDITKIGFMRIQIESQEDKKKYPTMLQLSVLRRNKKKNSTNIIIEGIFGKLDDSHKNV